MNVPATEELALAEGSELSRTALELRPLVRAVVARLLSLPASHADVEDATQETLCRALENLATLEQSGALKPWLTGIARHVALDSAKRWRREHPKNNITDEDSNGELLKSRALVDPRPGPDQHAMTVERSDALRRALDKLPKEQREVLFMFHLEGLGYQDIATRLNVPLGTVATWVTRARKSVATAVNEGGP